jgi:hypothetical protein
MKNEGFEDLTALVMNSSIFWDITPCSPLKVNRLFGGIYHLNLQSRRMNQVRNERESRWQYAILKMEATNSSETSVDFQRTTWLYIPENTALLDNEECSHATYWKGCVQKHSFTLVRRFHSYTLRLWSVRTSAILQESELVTYPM